MRVLKKFEFRSSAARSQYDWDKFLAGDIVQLEKGEGKDFDCSVTSFKMMAYKQAEKRGLGIRINIDGVEGEDETNAVVTLQSYELTEQDKERRKQRSEMVRASRAANAAKKVTVGDTEDADDLTDSELEEVATTTEQENEVEEEEEKEVEPEPEPVKPAPSKNGKKGKK